MRITRKGHAIHLDQCAYLQKVIKKCGMLNVKAASTPLPAGYYALANKDLVNPELCSRFQMVIGSLLYLMLGTRPDIAFAVTHLSRVTDRPVLPWPYRMILRGGVMVLEGAGIPAKDTGSCT